MARITDKTEPVTEKTLTKRSVKRAVFSAGGEAYDHSDSPLRLVERLIEQSPSVPYSLPDSILTLDGLNNFLKLSHLSNRNFEARALLDEYFNSYAYECIKACYYSKGRLPRIHAIRISEDEKLTDIIRVQREMKLEITERKLIPLPTLPFIFTVLRNFRNVTWKPGRLLTSPNAAITGSAVKNLLLYYGKGSIMHKRQFHVFSEAIMTVPDLVKAKASYMVVLANNLKNVSAN